MKTNYLLTVDENKVIILLFKDYKNYPNRLKTAETSQE